MSQRTVFFGRLIGFSFLVIAAAILFFPNSVVAMSSAILTDRTLYQIAAALTILFGLAMVILHSRWSGGLVPIAIALFGWAALIKGGAFLFIAPEVWSNFLERVGFQQYYLLYATGPLILGVWLSFSTLWPRRS
jgi:hypothetical protein